MRPLLLLLLLFPIVSFAQNRGDSKIIVTLNRDSLYEKVKIAMVKSDFIVKEDGEKNVLTTYPREFKSFPGYSIVKAEINGNKIIFTGSYGLSRIDDFGYTRMPKGYKRIIYYKGSKSWGLLMQVAKSLDGQLTFNK